MKPARLALLALALSLPTILASQATIGTGPAPGSPMGIAAWGTGDLATPSYGQTFRAPAGNTRLDVISFWLEGGSSLTFRAYVYAWDTANRRASGSALFTSAIGAAPGGSGYQRLDVTTGGVALAANTTYVAFLSTSGIAQPTGGIGWEISYDEYGDGSLVWLNNPDDASRWTSAEWSTGWDGSGGDLRFEMAFNQSAVIPEPSTYALMATGLVGLAGIARRRRRA